MRSAEPIPFVDLRAQHGALAAELQAAFQRVTERGWFVLGDELEHFEEEFASLCTTRHCVGVGNGFDALWLTLEACGVGPGDEVIVPSHTFFATVAAVSRVGATPVFVDVDAHSARLSPDRLAEAVTPATKAVIPVHLYGGCADMESITDIATEHGLVVIEDAAQAHGADHRGRIAGSMGRAGCFSFYPTKNLGACGDGGAITTDDDQLAERLRVLRNYGQDRKYHHVEAGVNTRLDELQAAVLRVKLPHLSDWNAARRRHASAYGELLAGAPVDCLTRPDESGAVFHVFVIRMPDRDALLAHLSRHGVRVQIHYPVPVHLQPPYGGASYRQSLPVTEALAKEVLSLPMYPELDESQVELVCDAIRRFEPRARRDAVDAR